MTHHYERRLQRLIRRLPNRLQLTICWLRRPSSRWARISAGLLLTIGLFLSILPFFGLWMMPLGLMLLAEDIPPLRRSRDHMLDWLERHVRGCSLHHGPGGALRWPNFRCRHSVGVRP